MIYLKLFLSFLQIGLFSFGGGYAAMPLIQEQVVTQHGWLTMTEFTDLITISQMTPGPIAINAATFVGSKIAGVPGSVAATCGCILPSCIIVTLIAWFYLRYKKMKMFQSVLESLRPAVVALIAARLFKLAHYAVHVLHGGAATRRDALAAAGVEDAGIPALARGHAADDGFGLFHGVLVDFDVGQLVAHTRQHAQHALQPAHLFHLLHLAKEVLQGELVA